MKTWSDTDNATLLLMKEARKTDRAIGDFFGVSEKAAAMQYGRMRSAARGDRKGERWAPEENAILIAAGDKGEAWGQIGRGLQRTGDACKVQYNFLKRKASGAPAKVSIQRFRRETANALAKEVRNTLPQQRSITAEIFGDPLPGRSALDQRRAGQGDQSRPSLAAGVSL